MQSNASPRTLAAINCWSVHTASARLLAVRTVATAASILLSFTSSSSLPPSSILLPTFSPSPTHPSNSWPHQFSRNANPTYQPVQLAGRYE